MDSNKVWIKNSLARKDRTKVPFNFSFSPPARAKLEDFFSTGDLEDLLNFPIRMSSPASVKPLYANPATHGDNITDEFGVFWSTSPLDRGSPTGNVLKEPSLSGYKFPNPEAEYRFSELGSWCRKNSDNFTIVWIGDLWERATFMRGMEELLVDVSLHRRFIEELLRKLTDFILATMEILFERFEFDAVALSDDYGTQQSLIISPDLWRKLVKPLLAEIYSFAGKHGRKTFHHSCGNVESIVGDFIDVGLDILHPIQPEVMDIFKLKKEYGEQLAFCGGIRTQDLLPDGKPDDIRLAVRKLKEIMGKGGGYILEPGITIQADVPLENMLAMIEEAKI